jgi:biopolymer transport protein ExbD
MLAAELEKAVQERHADPYTGRSRPSPVTIHAYEDVTYGDVARAVDLLKNAGFEKIDFGGGRPSQRKKR